jgi:hypothetical protein
MPPQSRRIPVQTRRQLCAAAHNCIYVHRPIMCSGGVVIGVSPAMRPPGRCTAEHNRQRREDHRGRQRCESNPGRLGTARSSPSPSSALTPLDSTSLPPELRSADVRPRSTPVAWISPDRRVARVFREPSIMCSSQCTERALSRGNKFPSEPVVHNRTLNIEAGLVAANHKRRSFRQRIHARSRTPSEVAAAPA